MTGNSFQRSRGHRAAMAAAMPAAFMLALANPLSARAVPSDDFPTWDEVEQARATEATAKAEIEKIEGILVRLEQEAAQLGTVALQRGEEYAQARDALDEATTRLERISTQAAAAQERADESERRVAVLVAQLARTGGGDVSVGLLLGSADNADQLLARLGTMGRISDSSAVLLERAIYDKKTAGALAADAKAAERERRRLAEQAATALAGAEDAAGVAEEAAASQRADADRMYAQLAALKGTTAEVERAYAEGQVPPAPPTSPSPPLPPPTTPPPTTPPPTSPPTTPPPAPSTSAVETAIAFASAQLGKPYAFGGAGPDAWDCSGLTKMSYAAAGIYIGTHSVSNQYATLAARGGLVPVSQLQRGDLVFYASGGSMYHVAVYLGGNLMLEAPRPGAPVRIVPLRTADLVANGARPA